MAAMQLGFASPVGEAQSVFRACLAALSRPGLAQDLPAGLTPPKPLTPELAAVALALADPDAPVWLDPALAREPAIAEYLRFQTGAPIVSKPAKAAFALVRRPDDLPPADLFALGSQDYPDRSTTIVLAVDELVADGSHLPSPLWGGPSPTLDLVRGEDRGGGRAACTQAEEFAGPPPPGSGFRPSPPSPQGGGQGGGKARPDIFAVTGPGVKGVVAFAASPLPPDFLERARANHALFPRGVDWLLVGQGRVVGLPRSARPSLARAEEAA